MAGFMDTAQYMIIASPILFVHGFMILQLGGDNLEINFSCNAPIFLSLGIPEY